jgi:hypothetical protein
VRPALIASFDLGVSYGLNDSIFPSGKAADPETGMVGLEPAIGHGLRVDISREVIDVWRQHASVQAHRDVAETGRVGAREEFDAALEQLIRAHPVDGCALTVYAVGTVFVELRFAAGIEGIYLRGLLKCFEFAGYKPPVARALHASALRVVTDVLEESGAMASPLTALTVRAMPRVVPDDSEEEPHGGPYLEQLLIPSFTQLLICTDQGDAEELPAVLATLDPDADPQKRQVIKFEYHGELWTGWAVEAVVARRFAFPDDPGIDEPEDQVKRMLACIKVAHVFYGTCAAFERLFLGEIDQQVDGYLRKESGGRLPDDLNRLRNLALAVASLTGFSNVTQSAEDQQYFQTWEADTDIQRKRDFIREAADLLYNVSDAETQANRSRREITLNLILLLLTTVTLLSVSADAYDFIRDDDALIGDRGERARVLVQFLLALLLAAILIVFLLSRPERRRRARGRARDLQGFDDPTRPAGQ